MTGPGSRWGWADARRQRDQFRLLAAGTWVSQFGNGVTNLTVLLALDQWSRKPGWGIAAYAIAGVVPSMAFGVFAGALADRFDRRRLMVGADLLQAVLVALMVLSGPDRLWLLFVLAFGVATVRTVSAPAASAMVPAIVGVDGVGRAQATLIAGTNVCRVAGLGLAGVLFAGHSTRTGFLVDAATFVVASACKSRLTSRPPATSVAVAPLGRLVREGAALLRRSRSFGAVLFVFASSTLAGAAIHVLYVPFTVGPLHAPPTWLAVLEGAGVVGLVGTGVFLRRRPALADTSMFPGLALSGAGVALFGAAPHVAVLVPLEVVVGAGLVVLNSAAQAVVARLVPEDMLGRAYGALAALTEASSVGSLVLVGLASNLFPARSIFAGAGLFLVVCAAVGSRVFPGVGRAAERVAPSAGCVAAVP